MPLPSAPLLRSSVGICLPPDLALALLNILDPLAPPHSWAVLAQTALRFSNSNILKNQLREVTLQASPSPLPPILPTPGDSTTPTLPSRRSARRPPSRPVCRFCLKGNCTRPHCRFTHIAPASWRRPTRPTCTPFTNHTAPPPTATHTFTYIPTSPASASRANLSPTPLQAESYSNQASPVAPLPLLVAEISTPVNTTIPCQVPASFYTLSDPTPIAYTLAPPLQPALQRTPTFLLPSPTIPTPRVAIPNLNCAPRPPFLQFASPNHLVTSPPCNPQQPIPTLQQPPTVQLFDIPTVQSLHFNSPATPFIASLEAQIQSEAQPQSSERSLPPDQSLISRLITAFGHNNTSPST